MPRLVATALPPPSLAIACRSGICGAPPEAEYRLFAYWHSSEDTYSAVFVRSPSIRVKLRISHSHPGCDVYLRCRRMLATGEGRCPSAAWTERQYLDRACTGSLITTDRDRETQSHRHRQETKQTKTTTDTAASCPGRHCTIRMVSPAPMIERQYLDQAWTATAEIETQNRGCELGSWCSRLHGTRRW